MDKRILKNKKNNSNNINTNILSRQRGGKNVGVRKAEKKVRQNQRRANMTSEQKFLNKAEEALKIVLKKPKNKNSDTIVALVDPKEQIKKIYTAIEKYKTTIDTSNIIKFNCNDMKEQELQNYENFIEYIDDYISMYKNNKKIIETINSFIKEQKQLHTEEISSAITEKLTEVANQYKMNLTEIEDCLEKIEVQNLDTKKQLDTIVEKFRELEFTDKKIDGIMKNCQAYKYDDNYIDNICNKGYRDSYAKIKNKLEGKNNNTCTNHLTSINKALDKCNNEKVKIIKNAQNNINLMR